ncbi:MAG: hypothetical protein ACYDAM_09140 [Leptospirales bacterium]
MDDAYRRIRSKAPRRELFNDLKFLTRRLFFDSWDSLIRFLLKDDDLFDSG